MNELKLILEIAPYLVPFFGAIFLIIFTKKYLFVGMISTEMHLQQLDREREVARVQEEIAMKLTEIVDRLEAIKIERRSGNERRKFDDPDQPGNLE